MAKPEVSRKPDPSPLTASDLAGERPPIFRDAPPPDAHLARLPLWFVSRDLEPQATELISAFPQYDGWQGEAMRVAGDALEAFELHAPVVGCVPTLAGGSQGAWMPAAFFDQWKRIDLLATSIGTTVDLEVRNVSKVRAQFRGVIFGRVSLGRYELGRVRTTAERAAACTHEPANRVGGDWCSFCGALQTRGVWRLSAIAQARLADEPGGHYTR